MSHRAFRFLFSAAAWPSACGLFSSHCLWGTHTFETHRLLWHPFLVNLRACARVHHVLKDDWLCTGDTRDAAESRWVMLCFFTWIRWDSGTGWWQEDESPCGVGAVGSQGNRLSMKPKGVTTSQFCSSRCCFVPLNWRNPLILKYQDFL